MKQLEDPFLWYNKSVKEVLQFIQRHLLEANEDEVEDWLAPFEDHGITSMEHVMLMTRQEWESLPLKIGLRAVMEHIMGIRHEAELLTQSAFIFGKDRGFHPVTASHPPPGPGQVPVVDSAVSSRPSGPTAIPTTTTTSSITTLRPPGRPGPPVRKRRYDSDEEEARYKLKLDRRVSEEMAKHNHSCGYTVLNSMEVHCHECDQTLRMNIRGQARNWVRHCFGVSGTSETNHMQRFRKNLLQRQVDALQSASQHVQHQSQQPPHQPHEPRPTPLSSQTMQPSPPRQPSFSTPVTAPSAERPGPRLVHLSQQLFPPTNTHSYPHNHPPSNHSSN